MKPTAYMYTCRNLGQVALKWPTQSAPTGPGWIDVKQTALYVADQMQFTPAEMNNFRQWFNALSDTNPNYIDQSDRDLYTKLMGLLK